MLSLAMAMAAVILTWAIIGAAFVGLGLLVRRLWGLHGPLDASATLFSFWVGFAIVILFLQVWNFVLPVNLTAEVIVLAVGCIGLALHRRGIGDWLAAAFPKRFPQAAVVVLVSLWLANRSIGPANADDSGLYHFSAILWAKSYPVVPGIGNLAATLALNNGSFLYAAMLDHGPWAGRVEHIANGLLLLVFWVHVLRALWLAAGRRGWLPENIYWAALLPIAVMLTIAKDVSSPKTDLSAGVLMMVIGGWLLRFVLMPERRERSPAQLIALATLCSAAVCLKISTLVFAAVAGVIALIVWWRAERPDTAAFSRAMGAAALMAALLLGPWIGRNIIMSGYPAYPSRFLPAAVEWRVPEPAVAYLADEAIRKQTKGGMTVWIHNVVSRSNWLSWYAPLIKPPFENREQVQGWNWLRSWLFAMPLTSSIEIVMPLLVALGGGLVLLRRKDATSNSDVKVGAGRVLTILPLASLAFWFIAAPDPRYGWPAAWMLMAFTMAMVLSRSGSGLSPHSQRFATILLSLSVVAVVGYRFGVQIMLDRQSPLHEVVIHGSGSDHGFHPRPVFEVSPIVNRWGLTIYVPGGERPYYCFNGPLPCSGWPPLDPDLRPRKPSDLGAGFMIDRSPS